ncbi:MAG: archaellin/type IV pilin N-terminal domain-containing protein [Nitrosopumilus sp.]
MTKLQSKQNKLTSRRAVAPVIATLLLVAIAVVGGSIVFVFSQGFFSQAQVSGTPTIESLKIQGYDARDATSLQAHDGVILNGTAGLSGDGLVQGERVAVYIQNQGVQKATFSEVRFAGTVYSYDGTQTTLPGLGTTTNDGKFWILDRSTGNSVISATAPEIQPGQQATVILQLDENIKSGRDGQIKFSTSNGAVFVGTVIAGQQSG